MFTIKELRLLRKVIDNYSINNTELFEIRDKITDLIILKSQWNKKLNLCDLN